MNYFRNGAASGDIHDSCKFDVIFDTASGSGAGENYKDRSIELLCPERPGRKHGQYVTINGSMQMWAELQNNQLERNQHLFVYKNNAPDLNLSLIHI